MRTPAAPLILRMSFAEEEPLEERLGAIEERLDRIESALREVCARMPSIEGSTLFLDHMVTVLTQRLCEASPAVRALVRNDIAALIRIYRRGDTGPYGPVAIEAAAEMFVELLSDLE